MNAIAHREPRRMLQLDDLLAMVRVSRATLFRMEADGRLPRSHMAGNRKVWFADEIAEWQDTLPRSRVGEGKR